ncbi:MAG: AraC family transcriptional regulator [Phenylobacterium sp.]|uniref:helix-turn-helix domain-containing protein n=1 Tax=Phenylobacterium sp. TaxID=1871053 RepID=UPI002734DFE8|nr:AraC family transcriptional regulator [Phenylobacterium sp.]MDP3746004.1 AraC family transcriptional regulator [Phenylobacterium sp.]
MIAEPPVRQNLAPRERFGRHRHERAYVALVLRGGYHEAGEAGRRRLVAGDVAIHEMFDGHLNAVAPTGAVVLNLEVGGLAGGFATIADPDAVARLAERDAIAAGALLRASLVPITPQALDWPDLLARDLAADPGLALGDWARAQGLAAETLSRGFGRAFGISPKRFRYEGRARTALRAVIAAAAPLADLALEAGFADQAHMSRAVSDLTGHAPGVWRRGSSGCKTAA